jgi:hypothetical protein
VTIHEAAFDGLGRRVVKTVSNSGDLDGVTEYYHNSNQIIETRDASANLEMQVYHGTQYIDEVVGQRIANMGRVYVHQDANYNVTTDLTARQIECNYYSTSYSHFSTSYSIRMCVSGPQPPAPA